MKCGITRRRHKRTDARTARARMRPGRPFSPFGKAFLAFLQYSAFQLLRYGTCQMRSAYSATARSAANPPLRAMLCRLISFHFTGSS